jgi:hypothetical protein
MAREQHLFLVLLIASSLFIIPVNAWEIDQTGKIEYIIDGDTFYLTDGDRVRLADINTPELGEEGYDEAITALDNLIDDKKVFLDTDQLSGRDDFGRLIAVVYVKHNSTHYKNVNYMLWKIRNVAVIEDYTNNEFDPYTWTKFIQYAGFPEPPPPEPPLIRHQLTIIVEGQGTIDHPIGPKMYEENTEVIITATPKEYWRINSWILNSEPYDSSKTIKFTMNQDIELKIEFSLFLPNCTVLFNITDDQGIPLNNASIKSFEQPEYQHSISLTSGVNGKAESELVYNGYYLFLVEKEGYVTKNHEIWLEKDETRYEQIRLEMRKINLKITLKDSMDNHVEGVKVSSKNQPENQGQVSGVTNSVGLVIFNNVFPGSYIFDVQGDFVNSTISVDSDRIESSFIKSLRLYSELMGFIVDDDGNTLEGVEVYSVITPVDQEPLSIVCDGQFLFSQILSGNYTLTLRKDGYKSVNRSMFLVEGTTEIIDNVILYPISLNYTPIIITSLIFGAIVIAAFLWSQKSIPFYQKITQKLPRVEVSEEPLEVETIEPSYLGDYKEIIIKVIYDDGVHNFYDIRKNSGLEDDVFWDAFYELLSQGILVSNDKGEFYLSKEGAQLVKESNSKKENNSNQQAREQ